MTLPMRKRRLAAQPLPDRGRDRCVKRLGQLVAGRRHVLLAGQRQQVGEPDGVAVAAQARDSLIPDVAGQELRLELCDLIAGLGRLRLGPLPPG